MQKGMVLISVLIMSVLLVLISVSMVSLSTSNLAMIGGVESYDKALKAAEAGTEYVMAKINADPAFGTDGNTTISETLPSGASFTITFNPGAKYYSYNNLKSDADYERTTGEIKGKVPPYSAEIISVGKNINGFTKIIRVLLVRDDALPGNAIGKGQIVFVSGEGVFSGSTGSDAGFLSSDWEPNSVTTPTPSIYSESGTADLKKGLMSAKGKIKVTDSGDGSFKDENSKKSVKPADIDIDAIMTKAASGSVNKTDKSYYVTAIHGINEKHITDVLDCVYSKDDLIDKIPSSAAQYSSDPPTGEPGKNDTYRQHTGWSDAWVDDAGGVTKAWISGKNGTGTSWDKVEVDKIGAIEEYTEYQAKEVQKDDPLTPLIDESKYEWEVKKDKEGKPITTAPSSKLEYSLVDEGVHWGGKYPTEWETEWIDSEAALVKTASANTAPVKTNVTYVGDSAIDGFKLMDAGSSFKIQMTGDIYFDTPGSPPKLSDASKSFNDVSSSVNAFTISRISNLKSDLMGKIQKSYLDMYGYNLYSESHTALGLQVKNKNTPKGGLIVSQGKLGYIYGFDADSLIPVAEDDLYLPISEEDVSYNINGFMYSNNDVVIDSVESNNSQTLSSTGEMSIYPYDGTGATIKSVAIYNSKKFDKSMDQTPLNSVTYPKVDPSGSVLFSNVSDNPSVKTYIVGPSDGKFTYSTSSDSADQYSIDLSKCSGAAKGYQLKIDPSGNVSLYQARDTNPPIGSWKKRQRLYVPVSSLNTAEQLVAYKDIFTGNDPATVADGLAILSSVGKIFVANYASKDINITGRIVANNKVSGSSDNNGERSVILDPGAGSRVFSKNDVGNIKSLIDARDSNFTVRRLCWQIIK